MRFRNESPSIKYCKIANRTLNPGGSTRELDCFTTPYRKLLNESKGFTMIPSTEDLELMLDFLERFVAPAISAGTLSTPEFLEAAEDPDGRKLLRSMIVSRRELKAAVGSKVLHEEMDHEAKIRAESNPVDELGRPISDKAMANGMLKGEEIKPVKHDAPGNDLKSVMEHNLAIMTTASGQPIRNPGGYVAKPGGSPVSHNPKDYQKPRKVPAGVPDFSE